MEVRFEEVELVADVVALAVIDEAVQSLFAHERGHGIGELEFAAFAGFRVLQVMEDARAQDIAGADSEIRWSFLNLGFFDEDIGFDEAGCHFGTTEDAVTTDFVRRNALQSHGTAAAGLDAEERSALAALLDGTPRGPAAFDQDVSVLQSAQLKLARAGLRLYAQAQRRLAGEEGQRFYDLVPDAGEWSEAKRLAQKFDAQAVIFGHTHAARWQQQDDLTYVNTGTWIWLMRLPAPSASEAEWTEFLERVRRNPRLDPRLGQAVPLVQRLTYAMIEPAADGAALSLCRWLDGQVEVLGQQHLPARPAVQPAG